MEDIQGLNLENLSPLLWFQNLTEKSFEIIHNNILSL